MSTDTRLRASNRLVGASVRRKEDPRFLRGRGNYVDDLAHRGALHVAFFRSPLAHGRLKAVDVSEATRVAGVAAVFTATHIAPFLAPLITRNTGAGALEPGAGFHASEIPILARDKVIYVGQPIAIVVADSRHAAEDGVAAIRAEFEPLPPVLDVDAALRPGAPLVHEAVPLNSYNHFHSVHGDIDKAFAEADLVVELELRSGRCAVVPMEPRAIVAEWDPLMREMAVWVSHQAPHLFRTGMSKVFGLPESQIRVISPDVGGGFGVKMAVYPEDVATIAAARLVGRPLKWICDRREDLLTSMQSREHVHRVRAAVRKDGRLLGVKVTIKASNGAYSVWPVGAGLDSGNASEFVPGPYDIAAYERDVYAVATTKAPLGPYRGVGRTAACFTIERVMDEIARRLDLEPLEVRRRNIVRDYPFDNILGLRFESGSSLQALDEMGRLLELPKLRRKHAELRKRGIYRGVGFAAIIELTAPGGKQMEKQGAEMVLGYETAVVRVEPDGQITLLVGTHSHGQGHETTFAQVVANEFGVPVEQVTVRFGDTAVTPYGLGTWATRSTVYAGGAAILASTDMKTKLLAIAAHVMQRDAGELVFEDGAATLRGDPAKSLSLRELAHIAYHHSTRLPDSMDPGLDVTRRYRAPEPGTFSNSLHAAVVEVDVMTGAVSILRYVVIEDCGTLINPLIVDGQLMGGIAQGIGQALLEEMPCDAEGQPLATTLADYLLSTSSDIPRIEIHHIETPSPHSLGGFKGMGEGGAVNPPAAIANAVTDALSPFGIAVNELPIRPAWIAMAVRAAGTPG